MLIVARISAESMEANLYLKQYGYLNNDFTEDGSLDSILQLQKGLLEYQRFNNLTATGMLNSETFELMQKPRCGNIDYPQSMGAHKWNKTHLLWSFPKATPEMLNVAMRVFDMWRSVTNLNFSHSFQNPDILITFANVQHNKSENCMKISCNEFQKGVLGHAFKPSSNNECVEAHMNSDNVWYMGMETVPVNENSFFYVLLHEIGHTLGLEHSEVSPSVMSAYYDWREVGYRLYDYDVKSIQKLYGSRDDSTTPNLLVNCTSDIGGGSSSSSSNSSASVSKEIESNKYPDLCHIRPEKFLLTLNRRLYVFHKDWAWIIPIGEFKYRKPEKIGFYLPFDSFKHIYQKSNGDIVILRENVLYVIDISNFKIKQQIPITKIIGQSYQNATINALFASYTGTTYIFYNQYYFVELGECDWIPRSYNIVHEKFSGIPPNVESAFRYSDGVLYFFKEDIVYEYNEFENRLLRAEKFDISKFDIHCPRKSVFIQIQELLTKFASYEEESDMIG